MHRLRSIAIALTNISTIVASVGFIHTLPLPASSSARSSSVEQPPPAIAEPKMSAVRSLEELYQIRDRLVTQIEAVSKSDKSNLFDSLFSKKVESPLTDKLLQKLQEVEVKILVEQRAKDSWEQSQRLATKADNIEKLPNQSLANKEERQILWEQAIQNLNEIPKNSWLASQIHPKFQEYQRHLATATYELNQTNFLVSIARQSGLSNEATIAVCHLSRYCVRLRGDRPPASAASLIKIPIAIALLEKVNEAKISLDTPIYVQRGNFTEDASAIRALQRYPLKTLLGEMIDHSSNIATNQLIDYLGQDYINKFLDNSGYKATRVNFKLMGDRIMPYNPGRGPNRLTSDELTEMMVQIYNREIPGSEVLMEALSRQYDRVMGYAAVQGSKAQWLGEKTGENSRALGTTLAIAYEGEIYVITVIDNRPGSYFQIRNSIAKIIEHISDNGGL